MTSDAQPARRPLRDRSSRQRVTNVELFTDLVYIFAVTQLALHLRSDPTLGGTLQSLLLLTIFWLIWIHTTWITNWVDPECLEIRLLLVAGMLVSLAMAVAVPRTRALGLVIGGGYAVMVIGRSLFMVIVLRGPLQKHFERLLAWRSVVGGFALAGGLVHDPSRTVLWVLAVTIDVTGTIVGFPTPGLGRSRTQDWAIAGDPGRLGRSAYHLIHPVMVAGIIVWAAGDEKILTSPLSGVSAASAWMILGGPALFLAGHAAFKFVLWRIIPWSRIIGVAALALLALAAAALPQVALAACAAVVATAVATTDHYRYYRYHAT